MRRGNERCDYRIELSEKELMPSIVATMAAVARGLVVVEVLAKKFFQNLQGESSKLASGSSAPVQSELGASDQHRHSLNRCLPEIQLVSLTES